MKPLANILLTVIWLHLGLTAVHGQTIVVTEDMSFDGTNFTPGDSITVVGMQGPDSALHVTIGDGAEVDGLFIRDFGVVDISGGTIGSIDFGSSAPNFKAGQKVNITGGEFVREFGIANNGTMVISGGTLSPDLQIFFGDLPGTLHVFGNDLRLDPVFFDGIEQLGLRRLTGTLADNSPLDVFLRAFNNGFIDENTFLHNVAVPEPGTFVLAGMGLLALAVMRTQRRK